MKDTKDIFAVNVDSGEEVGIETEDLVEHRLAIYAGSGGGKSRLARSICEKGHGKFQQILISPKMEYVTLREKFDYLHVGKTSEIAKPDIELNTRYAGQLALKLLESHADTVIEFSQSPLDRVKYVKNFIESLMSSPMHLWHPAMILIDEIDIWAPEKGHGEAESLAAISDLAARGRDKGFFLVGITQNLAKFNKDVAAELDIKIVGKITLDTHQTRAAQELGIPLKEKGKLRLLGKPNYHFYAYGPGLSDDVIKITSLPVKTTHVSGYKRNQFKAIPTPEKIKQIVSQFADLPQEAEKELKTKEDLMRRIKEQETEIRSLKNAAATSSITKIDPQALQKAEQNGVQKGFKECEKQFQPFVIALKAALKECQIFFERNPPKINFDLLQQAPDLKIPESVKYHVDLLSKDIKPPALKTSESTNSLLVAASDLSEPERKVLIALAQRGPSTRNQIAVLAQYSPTSGGFAGTMAKLKAKYYIESNGTGITITKQGLEALGPYDQLPTDIQSLLRIWRDKLGESAGKILTFLCENYPNSFARNDIATNCNYSPTSGGFAGSMALLSKMELIEKTPEGFRASKNMFPEN